jgi:hypothetical protein
MMPNISFVKMSDGSVAVCANDTKALTWIMQAPPPKTIPVLITQKVAKELENRNG